MRRPAFFIGRMAREFSEKKLATAIIPWSLTPLAGLNRITVLPSCRASRLFQWLSRIPKRETAGRKTCLCLLILSEGQGFFARFDPLCN
jgi:hypothetical protein